MAELNFMSNKKAFQYNANTEYNSRITANGLYRIDIGDVDIYFIKQHESITYLNTAWVSPYLQITVSSNSEILILYTVTVSIIITYLG